MTPPTGARVMSDLLLKGGGGLLLTHPLPAAQGLSHHLQEYSGFALKEKKLFGALKAAWRFHQCFHL